MFVNFWLLMMFFIVYGTIQSSLLAIGFPLVTFVALRQRLRARTSVPSFV